MFDTSRRYIIILFIHKEHKYLLYIPLFFILAHTCFWSFLQRTFLLFHNMHKNETMICALSQFYDILFSKKRETN